MYAKLQSRIPAVAGAVQSARLHHEMILEQQAIMLSAGGRGTETTWTAMHKSPTDLRILNWRTATTLRLGAPPDAAPPATCDLRKGNEEDPCAYSLTHCPHHTICCKFGAACARPHRAVLRTLS